MGNTTGGKLPVTHSTQNQGEYGTFDRLPYNGHSVAHNISMPGPYHVLNMVQWQYGGYPRLSTGITTTYQVYRGVSSEGVALKLANEKPWLQAFPKL